MNNREQDSNRNMPRYESRPLAELGTISTLLPGLCEPHLMTILALFQEPRSVSEAHQVLQQDAELGRNEKRRNGISEIHHSVYTLFLEKLPVQLASKDDNERYHLADSVREDLAVKALALLAVAKQDNLSLKEVFGLTPEFKAKFLSSALHHEVNGKVNIVQVLRAIDYPQREVGRKLESLIESGICTSGVELSAVPTRLRNGEEKMMPNNVRFLYFTGEQRATIQRIVSALSEEFGSIQEETLCAIASVLGLTVGIYDSKHQLLANIVNSFLESTDSINTFSRNYLERRQERQSATQIVAQVIMKAYASPNPIPSADLHALTGRQKSTRYTLPLVKEGVLMQQDEGRIVTYTLNPDIRKEIDRIREELRANPSIRPESTTLNIVSNAYPYLAQEIMPVLLDEMEKERAEQMEKERLRRERTSARHDLDEVLSPLVIPSLVREVDPEMKILRQFGEEDLPKRNIYIAQSLLVLLALEPSQIHDLVSIDEKNTLLPDEAWQKFLAFTKYQNPTIVHRLEQLHEDLLMGRVLMRERPQLYFKKLSEFGNLKQAQRFVDIISTLAIIHDFSPYKVIGKHDGLARFAADFVQGKWDTRLGYD